MIALAFILGLVVGAMFGYWWYDREIVAPNRYGDYPLPKKWIREHPMEILAHNQRIARIRRAETLQELEAIAKEQR